MKLSAYLKDKIFIFVSGVVFLAVMALLFKVFRVNFSLICIWAVGTLLFFVLAVFWDYSRRQKFYRSFFRNLELLDEKYLVLEMLEPPEFYEGTLIYDALYEVYKSMMENVRSYEYNINDFKDYIEMWIHEVKIPIASLVLMCHNSQIPIDKKHIEQIRRMDNLVDQVLYYVRAENAEKDYLIKEVSLKEIVRKVAIRNKDDLLDSGIDLVVEHVDVQVVTDAKWLEFILNQLVNNSIKYKKEQPVLKIWAEQERDTVIHIWDNGVGIAESDLPRVFEKSFTGENGRLYAKSTGMGLYIVKNLCSRLGHQVEMESVPGQYTEVRLIIRKNDMYDVVG